MQPSYPNPDPVSAQMMRPSQVNILFEHCYCFLNFETEYPNLVGASFIYVFLVIIVALTSIIPPNVNLFN